MKIQPSKNWRQIHSDEIQETKVLKIIDIVGVALKNEKIDIGDENADKLLFKKLSKKFGMSEPEVRSHLVAVAEETAAIEVFKKKYPDFGKVVNGKRLYSMDDAALITGKSKNDLETGILQQVIDCKIEGTDPKEYGIHQS